MYQALRPILSLLLLLGFSLPGPSQAAPVTFKTSYGSMAFTFPQGWFANPEDHPYDLQCLSRDERMNTGVFVFLKTDLAETTTPRDIYLRQIEDMRSKRGGFKLLEAEQRLEQGRRSFTSVVYAGEKNLSRYFYRFTLIEFLDDPDQFAVALQVALPGDWAKSKPVLEAITLSAQAPAP